MRGPILFSLAVLSVAACTFPDVTYLGAPDGSSSEPDGSIDGPTIDGGGDDAAGDASQDHVADVASDSAPDANPDANPCDQDGDGFQDANNKALCGSNANDCCDHDSAAHPGQMQWFTMPVACTGGGFDYNCDMMEEPEYKTNVSCSGAIVCSGSAGFTGSPSCGTSGPYITCGQVGLSCVSSMPSTYTQACH